MKLLDGIPASAGALVAFLTAAAAGCASGPAAPGQPGYPAGAAAWTAALAAAGTPAELAEILTGRAEACVEGIRSIPREEKALKEAAGRALLRLVREALAPALRSLPPPEDLEEGFAASLRARLAGQARRLEEEAGEQGLPVLREAAEALRAAVRVLE